MSLLDTITNLAGGTTGSSGANSAQLIQQVLAMLGGNANTSGQGGLGGLSGLVNLFQNKGLGDLASSWVSTGENKPISPDQINHAMGDQISGLSSSLGLSSNDISAQLSSILPQLVDKLTPDGKVPDDQTLSQGLGALRGLFGN